MLAGMCHGSQLCWPIQEEDTYLENAFLTAAAKLSITDSLPMHVKAMITPALIKSHWKVARKAAVRKTLSMKIEEWVWRVAAKMVVGLWRGPRTASGDRKV